MSTKSAFTAFLNRNQIAIVLVISMAWAFLLAGMFRQTPEGKNPKVDAIAFYTAGILAKQQDWQALYSAHVSTKSVEMDAPAIGTFPGAPTVFELVEVETSLLYKQTALGAGYVDRNPPAFAYLPIYAFLFQGLTLFNWANATWVWDVMNMLALALGIALGIFLLFGKQPLLAMCCFVCLLILLPFSSQLQFSLFCGQVTPLIVGCSFLLMLPKQPHRVQEWGIGAIVAFVGLMKILPLLLVLVLLINRDHKRLAGFLFMVVLLLVSSVIVGGWEAHLLMNSSASALLKGVRLWTGNQSFEALVYRFFYSVNLTQIPHVAVNPQPLLIVLQLFKLVTLLMFCFVCWKGRHNSENRAPIAAVFCLLLALLPPLSWSHYGLYAIPAILILVKQILIQQKGKDASGFALWGLFAILIVCFGMNPDRWLSFPEQWKSTLGEIFAVTIYRLAVSLPFICMLSIQVLLIWLIKKKSAENTTVLPTD